MIHYTKEHIGRLLDKFMEGTSTLEEEDILSQYFAQDQIPAEWEEYRLLFAEFEAMKPQPKSSRRWLGWSVAAAIMAGILYIAIPSAHQEDGPNQLVAEADTTTTQAPIELLPDSAPKPIEQVLPVQTEKRRLRKPKPTIHDLDKAYALMAQVEREQREVEQQMAQCQQELIEAQLAAQGYIPVMQEDGTILYIKEQNELIAYEE